MPVFAAIDVGSNAMRLSVGSVNAARKMSVLENVRESVRLGMDVFTSGTISEETMENAIDAFKRFRQVIDLHGAQWTRAVATSATREALNRDLFIDRIVQESGIEVVVIGPDEEAVALWTGHGVPKERMGGLPRSANFWGPVGPTGPCRPFPEPIRLTYSNFGPFPTWTGSRPIST